MNKLIEAFLELPEVKRIHELEQGLLKNETIQLLNSELKQLQKQMVHAKEFHQEKQYKQYKEKYDEVYAKLLDYPFVEEYLELLEQVHRDLLAITQQIEEMINQQLK
ncbi:MAG: YlbF family regulator [Anaeroplasmataceae bacterium]|nr:YlbF family regulator [Anaeroplasmataceae bacterium]